MELVTTPSHFQMPGMASVHSHAFQRALRGRTQRKSSAAASFWSWRGLMYQLVEQITPDEMHEIAKLAYAELAMSGVTAVGEFHYVHHSKSGIPYSNRTILSEACIEAAREVGMRITLMRTGYMRGGYHKALEPAQTRFADDSVEKILRDVASLQQRYRDDPLVEIGVAVHSIRAVPLQANIELANYARDEGLIFHMHVSEQRKELAESIAEYGVQPVQLLADHGILSNHFVGIHATHLSPKEIRALGDAHAYVGLCRTTERDLGDGLPQSHELIQAGVKLCVGVDSHCCENAFEEIRAVEYDERSRLEIRHAVGEGPDLLKMATKNGYAAIGMPDRWKEDKVWLNRTDPSLIGLDHKHAADGIIFAATPRAVDRVWVNGKLIVENGLHVNLDRISTGYHKALARLFG